MDTRKKTTKVHPPGYPAQKYLFQYLSIEDLDPYDAPECMVEEWAEETGYDFKGHDHYASGLSPEDVKRFGEWIVSNKKGLQWASDDPYFAPAYLTLVDPKMLPKGTWLIHFTRETPFDAFDRGTTLEGLALSTWKKTKDRADCSRNLTDELGDFDYVYGFAMTAYWKRMNIGAYSRKYGPNAVLFQCDVAVEATHYGDEERQVIFPICSEYNVIPLWNVREGLRIRFKDSEDDGLEFETLKDLIDYVEKEEASGARVLERIDR